jgi:predicted acylesterase/phospholipase RssA
VFRREEITVDVLLASACLPNIFKAVEIEGEHYWDGGIMSNTPLQYVGEDLRMSALIVQVDLFNPEATEGYDPAVPVERDARGSIDPLMNTTNAVALFTAFRQGTAMSLMAILGVTAGNRFCVIAPAAKATGLRPGERDGLGQMDITFQLDGADSPVFLAQF